MSAAIVQIPLTKPRLRRYLLPFVVAPILFATSSLFFPTQAIAAVPNASVIADTSPSQSPTCETSGYALSWLLCAVIDGFSSGVDWIFNNVVQPFLATKPIDLSQSSSDPTHTFEIWSQFRVYGDILLVIAVLVIVYAEAIGGGVYEAYTVKKMLPRILVAAILINLSIYVVSFLIDATNIIGSGLANLIEAPFMGQINSGNYYVLQMDPKVGAVGSTVTIAAVIGALWKFKVAAGMLEYLAVTFLIPVFFILLAILATIVLRRGLILLLVFVAPVAFALYCLPNTEQYFRKWWDLLLKALLIYPIVTVLFALGNVLSVTISSSSTGLVDSSVASLVGTASLFLPLLLIPFSFRIAGGLMGKAFELASQHSSRLSEKVLGDRNDPTSLRNRAAFKKNVEMENAGLSTRALGARFNPRTAFNPAARQANVRAVRDARLKKFGQEHFEGDVIAKGNEGNDNFWLASAVPALAQKKLDAATDPTERAAWSSAIAAARQTSSDPTVRMVAAQKLFASGFQIDAGREGYNQMAEVIAEIVGADLVYKTDAEGHSVVAGATGDNAGTFANAMNQAQFGERQAGRFDLGGINNGQGYDLEAGLGKASGYTLGAQAKQPVYRAGAAEYLGGDAGSAINGLKSKEEEDRQGGPGTYERKLDGAIRQLADAVSGGNVSVDRLGEWHEKLLDARQNATGGNRIEIDKQLLAMTGAGSLLNRNPPADHESFERADAMVQRLERNIVARRPTVDPNIASSDT